MATVVGISLDNFPCVDPKKIAEYCASHGLSTSWYGKPNKYIRPIGAEPGYGHLLFQKSDYDALVRTGTTVYTLRMQSQYASAQFPGIMLAGFPRNLTPGAKDPVLMTEITDTTSNLLKATNTRYTWRDKPSSTTPVNAKTWETAAQDLWEKCQFADPFPGLPANIYGGTLDLEQFDCHGFRAISCLEDLLQALGCVLAYDPTQNTISIQYVAADQEQIIDFATFYRDLLVHDETPYNPTPLFSVPTQVRVLFPVWSEYTEEDPRVMYAKDVSLDLSSGLTGAAPNGTVILQDKQPLRVDSSGAALNQALIDNRAAAIAATYLDRIRTTTCQWPINRVYKGFIAGQNTPGLPGVMFDLVAWFDTGEGPMTAFLRQGIAGTGELYVTSSLPTAGLISTDHNPTMLVDGLGVVRANGIQPSQGRAKQNEGWWDDPTREVVRLVGTGLGSYMMRTQSLRYGEYAQVSTGGRGDLRGRLYRPWDEPGANGESADSKLKFFWVYGSVPSPGSSTAKYYVGYPLTSNDIDPRNWGYTASEYLVSANQETLQAGSRYLSRKTDITSEFDGNYNGSFGIRRLWAAECCGNDGGSLPPYPPPITPSDQQDLVGAGCVTCPIIPKYINILVQPGTFGALTATFSQFYIQGQWNGLYYTVPGTYSPALDFYISGGISCTLRGPGYFLPACFPFTPDFSNYFTFGGAVSGSSLPFSIVFDAGCTYYNQETPFSSVVCNPFSFVINLYFGLIKLTVSKA